MKDQFLKSGLPELPIHFYCIVKSKISLLNDSSISVLSSSNDLHLVKVYTARRCFAEFSKTAYFELLENKVKGAVLNTSSKGFHEHSLQYSKQKRKTSFSSLIGIIDTGMDLTHPDLQTFTVNNKIEFLWDQTSYKKDTTVIFGKTWSKDHINNGIHSDQPNGHGTMVAGIAAGSGGNKGKYPGVSPNSGLMIVVLNFNESTVGTIEGIRVLIKKAEELKRPLVINCSFGDYMGSHDDKTLSCKMIESMISKKPGIALVAAAGNNGNFAFHNKTILKSDSAMTFIEKDDYTIDYSLYSDKDDIRRVKVSFGCRDKSFRHLGRTKFFNYDYSLQKLVKDTIYSKYGNRLGVIQMYSTLNPYGLYELKVQIKKDSLLTLWQVESTGRGKFDSWNYNFKSNGIPDSILKNKSRKYSFPDTLSTLVSGLQCSKEVITVGNLSSRSSVGPTRSGLKKPDVLVDTDGLIAPRARNSELPAIDDYYIAAGGTSAASAYVSGWIANYFTRHPRATNRQVKKALIRAAKRKEFPRLLPN